jgi:hypothetical protein
MLCKQPADGLLAKMSKGSTSNNIGSCQDGGKGYDSFKERVLTGTGLLEVTVLQYRM